MRKTQAAYGSCSDPHRTYDLIIKWRFRRASNSALAVLKDWATPQYHDDVGTAAQTKRFRGRVTGPLPRAGEFTPVIRRYRDGRAGGDPQSWQAGRARLMLRCRLPRPPAQ